MEKKAGNNKVLDNKVVEQKVGSNNEVYFDRLIFIVLYRLGEFPIKPADRKQYCFPLSFVYHMMESCHVTWIQVTQETCGQRWAWVRKQTPSAGVLFFRTNLLYVSNV